MFDLPISGYLRANTIMKDLIRIATHNELLNVSGIQARKSNENFEFGIWEIGFKFFENYSRSICEVTSGKPTDSY